MTLREKLAELPLAIRLALAKRSISLRELAGPDLRDDRVWKRIAMTVFWEPRLRKAGKEWRRELAWRLLSKVQRTHLQWAYRCGLWATFDYYAVRAR